MSARDGAPPLHETFGQIDIYLFDQLLRGRLRADMRILDAGCGSGRNLAYMLSEGFEVFGVDRSPDAVEATRALAKQRNPKLPPENFAVAEVQNLPYADDFFDAVIVNAVLHFAETPAAFVQALDELWRVLRPKGLWFARLASSIGVEDRVQPLGDGRFRLPGGAEWYLVDEAALLEHTHRLGGELLDPIKTTNVQGLRCMTTWVVRKH